jgi:transcriptional regulator with XRE-family HTH domain
MRIRFSAWLSNKRLATAMTLEAVAKRIGSHKGYVSGIINEKVNPPSAKICARLGKLFRVHPGYVTYLAYRDKAPEAVQDRIALLEDLREVVQEYRNLEATTLPSTDSAEMTRRADMALISKKIAVRLNLLNTLYDIPQNGSGNTIGAKI